MYYAVMESLYIINEATAGGVTEASVTNMREVTGEWGGGGGGVILIRGESLVFKMYLLCSIFCTLPNLDFCTLPNPEHIP